METTTNVEAEIQKYISQLSDTRKKSILELIKFFAEEDEVLEPPQTIEEYNSEIEEAEKRMEAGEFYTHEEVVAMMNNLFK